MDYQADFFEARYHLDVAKRMLKTYQEFPEKRFLVGVVREAARAAGNLVRSFLIREKVKGDLKTFIRKVAPIYLDGKTIGNLVKILEVERAQRVSRIEFAKGDRILLLVEGKWKILKVSRLKEFVDSVDDAVGYFRKI
jgi:hypothetical protein